MRRHSPTWFAIAAALTLMAAAQAPAQVTWNIDNTTNIGGNAVTTVKGNPTVVSTPFGDALKFDGDDGIIVNNDPVAGAANFTIEMLFRPDPIVNASSSMPRVLFVQSFPNPPDHRAALEARIESNNSQWHIDTFLRSQNAGQGDPIVGLTLEEINKQHPLGHWYNYAMTYDGAMLKAYLNGQLESSGALTVHGMAPGRTSLGMRINQINHFEGIIAKARFTPSVVDPADFMSAVIPGDFDRNGTVEAADYNTWKSTFGATVATPGDGADGNSDGVVNAADYAVWRDHAPAGSAATLNQNVPEPSSIILIATAMEVLTGFNRSRRRIFAD